MSEGAVAASNESRVGEARERDTMATELLALLRDESAVGKERANDIQRTLQGLMADEWTDFWPEVCISYATGSREGIDSPGAGPGLLAAAIIVHKLHDVGIACASGLHVPAGANWKEFLPKIGGRFAKCKVLIVLLTRPFYKSKPCLTEVFKAAEAKNVTLIPLRCDEPLPGKEDQWPEIGPEDALRLEQVQSTLGNQNTMPPRGLFFDSPETLAELVQRIKGHVSHPAEPTPSEGEHTNAQVAPTPTTPRDRSPQAHFMHIVLQPPPGMRPAPRPLDERSPSDAAREPLLCRRPARVPPFVTAPRACPPLSPPRARAPRACPVLTTRRARAPPTQ